MFNTCVVLRYFCIKQFVLFLITYNSFLVVVIHKKKFQKILKHLKLSIYDFGNTENL